MIRSFKGEGTQDIYNGQKTKATRNICPESIWKIAVRKLDLLDSAEILRDLQIPPGYRLERLSGNRQGQHSIRINDRYRVCFFWTINSPDQVEIVDYH
jgi:proteic killer suppression protein